MIKPKIRPKYYELFWSYFSPKKVEKNIIYDKM